MGLQEVGALVARDLIDYVCMHVVFQQILANGRVVGMRSNFGTFEKNANFVRPYSWDVC